MARTVKNYGMSKRSERERLKERAEPYWTTINEGQHVGYYRGARGGKWVARYRRPGAEAGYAKSTLGEADDVSDANGTTVLDWRQAQEKARQWFSDLDRQDGRVAGPYTVGDALDDYLKAFTGKSFAKTKARADAIRPELGMIEMKELTQNKVEDWHAARAKSPARLRTSKGAKEVRTRPIDGDDAVRRRRSTANRDLTVLKAALNEAFRRRKVATDTAWRMVKPFKGVDTATLPLRP